MNNYQLYTRSFSEISADISFLDARERDRYNRFIHHQKKQEFLKGRVFIKQILGEYLAVSPLKVSLSISPNGRPFLPIVYGENVPFFNLAHTHGIFALGISDSYEIGVDVELIRSINIKDLKLFLSQEEYSILEQLGENKSEKLLELFVQKEAFIKATDKQWGLDEISFLLKENQWLLNRPKKKVEFYLQKAVTYLTAVCLSEAS